MLRLQRSKTPPKKRGVLGITRNNILCWRFSSGDLWNVEFSSLLLLPSPLWTGVVLSVRVPSMSRIDLFKDDWYLIRPWAKRLLRYNNTKNILLYNERDFQTFRQLNQSIDIFWDVEICKSISNFFKRHKQNDYKNNLKMFSLRYNHLYGNRNLLKCYISCAYCSFSFDTPLINSRNSNFFCFCFCFLFCFGVFFVVFCFVFVFHQNTL